MARSDHDRVKVDMAQSVMTGPSGGDWSFRKEIERMSNNRDREVSGLTLALQKPPEPTYKRVKQKEERVFSAPRRTGNWQNVAVEENNTVVGTSYATTTASAIEPATDPGSATVKCNIYLPRPEKTKRKRGRKNKEKTEAPLEVCVNGDETVGELIEKLPYYFNFEGVKLSNPIKALVLADDDGTPDEDCPHLDSGTRVAQIGFKDLAVIFKDGRKQKISSRAVNPNDVMETRGTSPTPQQHPPPPSSCNPSSFFGLSKVCGSPSSSPELGVAHSVRSVPPRTRPSAGGRQTRGTKQSEKPPTMADRCDLGCVIS